MQASFTLSNARLFTCEWEGGGGGSSILRHLRCEWIKNKLSSSHGHCFLVSIKMSKKCIFQAKIFGDRRSLLSRHLVPI